MTAYTDSMVAELTKTGSFDYVSATRFAEKYSLSPRSVVSKVKSLGLAYTPKPKAASKPKGPKKADVVAELAKSLGVSYESLEGLAKADMGSLKALVKATS